MSKYLISNVGALALNASKNRVDHKYVNVHEIQPFVKQNTGPLMPRYTLLRRIIPPAFDREYRQTASVTGPRGKLIQGYFLFKSVVVSNSKVRATKTP